MRVMIVLDEGLPHQMQTGVGVDTVASLQSAIKYLVKNKDTEACHVTEIEVYPLGIDRYSYEEATPLQPDDKLPHGSNKQNPIFVHVPREKQDLSAEQRRLYAMQPPAPAPKPKPERVEVTVRCYDGKQFKALVDPRHRISDLKKQFEGKSQVPAKNQKLSLDEEELKDKNTAAESGITDGCIIDLEPKEIQIWVREPDGNKIPVTMKLEDDILFVKESVAPETGIEVKQQILSFHLKELPNEATAKEIGLQNDDVLDLHPNTIEVYVRTPEGVTIPVTIFPSDTILYIKEEVADESGFDVPEQVLSHKGRECPNEKTAEELGLKDGSVLDLMPRTLQIIVRTPDGNEIPVTILPSDTIQFVKEDIADECGIEAPQQVLTHKGRELPNDHTAEELGLKDGDILDLAPSGMRIQVRTPEGELIPVKITPSDLIDSIKEEIAPQVGQAPANQRLMYEGAELLDGTTAEEMGLVDGCIVDLLPDTILVNVKSPEGETYYARIRPSETVLDIKEEIAPDARIEPANQILSFNGEVLPNRATAQDKGIVDGSTLYLERAFIVVNVIPLEGDPIPVKMKPSDTVHFLKTSVAPQTGIDVDDQIMTFNGDELPNAKTAEQVGLKHGSNVYLRAKYHPEPFDMSKNRVFYQLGDTVPYYIRINGWEGVGVLKERILETRGKRNCAYLKGITDASVLKVYPPGQDAATAKELSPDEDIPSNSSFEEPLIVVTEGDLREKKQKKMDLSIQDDVKQRMARRRLSQ